MTMGFDFDEWRANYDTMTHRDHVLVASRLWNLYPVQRHFDEVAVSVFLDDVGAHHVVEIGGYDGELASLVLPHHPEIVEWANIELCIEARQHTVCHDERYWTDATWERGVADALIMSHSAEHMRWAEVQAFLTPPRAASAVYLVMPLPLDGSDPDWDHYDGTHVLEAGWSKIDAYLQGLGFHTIIPRTNEVRCWSL